MPRTPPTPPPAPRRTPLQITDIVVGILLTLINALLGIVMLAALNQLTGLAGLCDGIAPDGTRCSPEFLNGILILGYGIVIFAWFLGLGALIVRAIRRQYVFFVPLVAGVVIFAAYYIVALILSGGYQPAG